MILSMLVLLQANLPDDVATQPAARIELPPAGRSMRCPAQSGGDIVVCGDRAAAEQFRLRPLPQKYAPPAGPGIAADLGKGVRGNLHAVQGTTIDGKTSPRIMLTMTTAF